MGENHRRTGLDKATIVRMLESLVHAGFVVRDEQDRAYQITGKTLMLSAPRPTRCPGTSSPAIRAKPKIPLSTFGARAMP